MAIVGAPFDIGTSYRPGARFGPSGSRNGARTLRNWHPDLEIYPFGSQQVVDAGDIPCSTYVIDDAIATIESRRRRVVPGIRAHHHPWRRPHHRLPAAPLGPQEARAGVRWSISMPTSTPTTPT